MILSYGYDRGLPEGVRAAWGARLEAPSGLRGRYQQLVGDTAAQGELGAWLRSGPLRAALEYLSAARYSGYQNIEHVVWEDDRGVILANCQASFGHVFLCAYLFDHLPAVAA